jgi:hypothetical protein
MNWIVRFLFVSLLTLTAGVSDAVAGCGSCGDAAHAEKGHHEKAGHNDKAGHHDGKAKDGHHDKAKDGEAGDCVCSKAKDGGSVWCSHCKVGHHEGKKIGCEGCYKKATGESKEDCKSCAKAHGDAAKEG